MKNRRGYFFSLDAFIAMIIILGVVLLITPSVKQTSPEMHLQEDLIKILSSIKIGELDNSYVNQLISAGKISDLNQSVLEQIGEFYAKSDPEAEQLALEILNQLNPDYNIGIYFNGIPIAERASLSFDDAKEVWTSRQIISGIQSGESVKGYSSRAFLSSSDKVDYFYFGGYVGDGNISVRVEDDISDVDIEAVFSGAFDLYINNQFIENYTPPASVPYHIDLSPYIDKFNMEVNYIDFRGNGNLYIAGGYIKIKHDTSSELISSQKKYFPGINGLINLYDSIYIPGVLNSMSVSLHYNSNYNIFFTLGNKTIYSGNTGGNDETITISNAELSSLLDYSEMSQKTIPFRIGIQNISYVLNQTLDADVFSVTDLSGSMDECVLNCTTTPIKMIDLAKDANEVFIDTVLHLSNNRVGLVGYKSLADEKDFHSLSSNAESLRQKVSSWKPGESTCICCGINKATSALISESDSGKFRSMVVMSDGRANSKCSQQGTGDPSQDAILAACTAHQSYGIIVNAVGFGENADEETLQAIASCGGGNYYYSSVEDLVNLYKKIAEDILNSSYREQTVLSEDMKTRLFSDSYILIDYTRTLPYGLMIGAESQEFGNTISEGSFYVPNNTEIYEVKATSYSGSKWTDKVNVRNESSPWKNVFDLSDYGREYTELGDPYIVNIPINELSYGENYIRVSTALNPLNSTGGSPYNKIIYTLVKKVSGYSPIVSTANGCNWILEFEDSSNSTINVPADYSGTKTCYYTSSNLAYNNNDAIDLAIFRLLSSLDLNSNRKIETKFSENDLVLTSTEVEGIPFTWDTEVQVRVWR